MDSNLYTALTYFYYDYRDPRTHDIFNILGELVRQLCLQDERCFAQLTKFTQEHSDNDGTLLHYNSKELCDLIREISIYFEMTMIVVDGLGETSQITNAGVAGVLASLNTPDGSIKTLFASRNRVDIAIGLQDYVKMLIEGGRWPYYHESFNLVLFVWNGNV
jgi:hypothetical protein